MFGFSWSVLQSLLYPQLGLGIFATGIPFPILKHKLFIPGDGNILKHCLFYTELAEEMGFLKASLLQIRSFYYNNWEIYVKIFSVLGGFFTTCKPKFKFDPIANKETNVVWHELSGRVLMLHEKHQQTSQSDCTG